MGRFGVASLGISSLEASTTAQADRPNRDHPRGRHTEKPDVRALPCLPGPWCGRQRSLGAGEGSGDPAARVCGRSWWV